MSSNAQPFADAATVFASLLERCEAGEPFDIDAVCAAHPRIADELRQLHSDWQRIARLASSSGPLSPTRLLELLADSAPARKHYRVEGEVARGGMGVIFKVFDERLRRSLAMKVLLERRADAGDPDTARTGPQQLVRFLDEAQITSQLDHPGIVPVHELGVDERGLPWFTMRMVKGRDLEEIFRCMRERRDGWTETRAVGVLLRACEALAFAHARGVIHRDLKPANIMVGRFGETYVMDWGLAKVIGRADPHDLRLKNAPIAASAIVRTARSEDHVTPLVTMDGDILGSAHYMSPEQAAGQVDRVGLRSDVYAMGAILYQLLAGERPYVGSEARVANRTVLAMVLHGAPAAVHQVNPRAPAELVAICEKAMARDPEQRYADMSEMASDLRAYLENRVVRAHRTGALVEFRKWVSRNRAFALSTLAAILIALGGLARSAYVQAREKRVTRELLRIAEIRSLPGYLAKAELLYPPHPDRIGALEGWLHDAEQLAARLEQYRTELRARAPASEPWQGDLLDDLDRGLGSLTDPDRGAIAAVRRRRDAARELERTMADAADAWETAITSIADRDECPAYGGLEIVPQTGLVPLQRDGASGLWEFWHVLSGERPRYEGGKIVMGERTGLVFVLVPGGTFAMGAQSKDAMSPNYDPDAQGDESPVVQVTLEPFFLAKFEMTQGQWLHATGSNPSYYQPGRGNRPALSTTLCHPVEMVSWNQCRDTLWKLGLTFPTEAQWEYAACAGRPSPWQTGRDRSQLARAGNLADLTYRNNADMHVKDSESWEDGFTIHAPVGSFAPNRFGLHDVHGNVCEWCLDRFVPYQITPRAGDGLRDRPSQIYRVHRGGGFDWITVNARTTSRWDCHPELAYDNVGVRPARMIDR
jgi:formylglycine-generating enzyme required for sulfatase activity/serine/threonine protein kinase